MTTPLQILNQYWGYPAFRPLQEDIIRHVLHRRDVLALLPTGGGKSLCYQVPALIFDGVTIIVSPLIALMKDQVARLISLNIPAAAIYSGMRAADIDRTLDNVRFGKTKMLYVSPERLKTDIFLARVTTMNVSLIAIDEAHCISQWGHDFRPSYLDVGEIRKLLPYVPVIALTASATHQVVEEIIDKLELKNVEVVTQSFARPNLHYHVVRRDDQLPYIEKLLGRSSGSGIVYVRHRRKSVDLADWFRTKKISSAAYHGGMNMTHRDQIQEDWIKGKTKCIVATNAFGMGVDKSDVRLVVHYDLPPGIEDYYQEAGRAGRDGKDGYCIVVVKPASESDLVKRVESSFPSIDDLKKFYKAFHIYLDLAVGSGKDESFSFDMDQFSARFNIKAADAFQAFSILEKDGWLVFQESDLKGSEVQFIENIDTLYSYQLADEKIDRITKALLRGYEGLWNSPVHIRESRLAGFLKWPEHKVIQQLEHLHKIGLIVYKKNSGKNQVTLLRERVPDANFRIDEKAYFFRKELAFKRMHSMLDYLNDDIVCREKFIREYFGETVSEPCGKCDACRKRLKSYIVSPPQDVHQMLIDLEGITVKDFLSRYQSQQHPAIKKELRQLAEEHKIRIIEDKIYRIK